VIYLFDEWLIFSRVGCYQIILNFYCARAIANNQKKVKDIDRNIKRNVKEFSLQMVL
jgi:hypothetical protein